MTDMDRALSDALVTVVKRDDHNHIYAVRFGTLTRVVIFRLIRIEGRLFDCEQSHHIDTPSQLGPYRSSFTSFIGKGPTLHKAIRDIAFYYRLAVSETYKPRENWLRAA